MQKFPKRLLNNQKLAMEMLCPLSRIQGFWLKTVLLLWLYLVVDFIHTIKTCTCAMERVENIYKEHTGFVF